MRVVAGDHQLSVSWSPPDNDGGSPVTGYVVIHSDGVGEAAVSVGSGTRSYRIGGLTNNVGYTVWVRARNRSGDGPTSAPIVVFPMGEALPPDRPSVTAVARGNRIEANWSANDNGARDRPLADRRRGRGQRWYHQPYMGRPVTGDLHDKSQSPQRSRVEPLGAAYRSP